MGSLLNCIDNIQKALCLGDVTLINKSLVYLHIRHSKTIQFGQKELHIPIAATHSSDLCPVTALISMLGKLQVHQLPKATPLFTYINPIGRIDHLTHSSFVKLLKTTLNAAGFDASMFSGHSFRRGGCSYVFQLGLSPLHLKMRGDWKSNAFERYVHVEDKQQMLIAQALSASL